MSAVSRQRAFLAAFRLTASVTKAAAAAQIERGMHYRWLADAEYAAEFERAKDEAAQSLEDEAVRRAHEGILQPVIYHGRECFRKVVDVNGQVVKVPVLDDSGNPKLDESGNGITRDLTEPLMIREYSDTLLIALLKAFRPAKYARNEVTGPNGGPIQSKLTVEFVDVPSEPGGTASEISR